MREVARAWEGIFGVSGKEDDGDVVFEIGRVVQKGSGMRIVVGSPREEWLVKAVEERDGVLIGGLVIGCASGKKGEKVRLDAGDGEFGVGGVFLEWDGFEV